MYKHLYDRYLFFELIKELLLWAIFVTVIFILGIFIEKLDDFLTHQATLRQIFSYLFIQAPYWLWKALPLAFLGATLAILEESNRTNELLALEVLGFRPLRIYLPILFIALSFTLLGGFVFENKSPVFFRQARDYFKTNILKESQTSKELTNFIAKGREGRYFVFGRLDPITNIFEGFWMDEWEGTNHRREIFAKSGYYNAQQSAWILKEVAVRTYLKTSDQESQETPATVTTHIYPETTLTLNEAPKDLLPNLQRPDEMTLEEIKNLGLNYEKRGIAHRSLLAEYETRRSSPLSFLIFGLIATTVISRLPRRLFKGKLLLFGVTLIVGIAYWFLTSLTKTLATHGLIASATAAWSVHVLLIVSMLLLRL